MSINTQATIEKKITVVGIDVEERKINLTLRVRMLDGNGEDIGSSAVRSKTISGERFLAIAEAKPDSSKTMYENISDMLYADLQAHGDL